MEKKSYLIRFLCWRWDLKTMGRGLILVLVSSISTLIFFELGFRCLLKIRSVRAVDDPILGWKAAANIDRRYIGLRADGKQYPIHFKTGKNGFRFFGNPHSGNKKILVLGDSFTEAYQVSNEKTYFRILADKLDSQWELFTYGMGGYGTYQEYLILDHYLDEIQPTLVIWQWCQNDFCNNLFEMDNLSIGNYGVKPRPYLENDSLIVRYPHEVFILGRYSKLWQWLAPRLFTRFQSHFRPEIDRPKKDSELFLKAVTVTDQILEKARRRLGSTPTYVFSVGEDEPYLSAFRKLAHDHDFHWIEGLDANLLKKKEQGVVINAHSNIGGHWSEEGHAAVADFLHQRIRSDSILK